MTVKFDHGASQSEREARALFYGDDENWIGSAYLKLIGDLAEAFQDYLDSNLQSKRYTIVASRSDHRVGIVDEVTSELLWSHPYDPETLVSQTPEQAIERYLPYCREAVARLREHAANSAGEA